MNAPTSASTAAVVTIAPDGGEAASSVNDEVPAAICSSTTAASRQSPPAPVTSSALSAALRACAERSLSPISRNEQTDVSSQNTNIVNRSAAITSPVIAPANATNRPTNRTYVASRSKYAAE
ncbi:unannotated protein [freshwater metagenome]|uniref:Unannotated protein n=1 Tax=freshwater metagenome TaxID=449393 RepID=A0A6J6EV11_9ZZZZ